MLTIRNIDHRLGQFRLQVTEMSLAAGQFHVLLGDSGAGKTLLLEIISGILPSPSGQIMYKNTDITSALPESRAFAYLPQDNALFPHLSVRENIGFGLSIRSEFDQIRIDEKVEQMASDLSIEHLMDRSIDGLSGGEQKRVALARALVLDTKLLLLDEPITGLQQSMQDDFCALLQRIQIQRKLTILMTTHHKDIALRTAEVLHFIDGGKYLLHLPKSTLFDAPISVAVARILGLNTVIHCTKKEDSYYCSELDTMIDLDRSAPNLCFAITPQAFTISEDGPIKMSVEKSYSSIGHSVIIGRIDSSGFMIKCYSSEIDRVFVAKQIINLDLNPKLLIELGVN